MTGCISTLSCGTDAEESWVQLENVRDTATVRNYAELCGFAYDIHANVNNRDREETAWHEEQNQWAGAQASAYGTKTPANTINRTSRVGNGAAADDDLSRPY